MVDDGFFTWLDQRRINLQTTNDDGEDREDIIGALRGIGVGSPVSWSVSPSASLLAVDRSVGLCRYCMMVLC